MGTDLKMKLERIPLEILNQGNYDLIDEIYAPDFVEHYAQPGIPPTREGFKQFVMAYRSAFPDLHYTVDDAIDSEVGAPERVEVVGRRLVEGAEQLLESPHLVLRRALRARALAASVRDGAEAGEAAGEHECQPAQLAGRRIQRFR